MENKVPIKRIEALKPLSRDHHHALLLCWKITTGFAKNVAAERIKKYCDWIYSEEITPHFMEEELFIYPVLGNDNEMIIRALEEHRELRNLFESKVNLEINLKLLASKLQEHVRFEERELFNAVQEAATPEQIEYITDNTEEIKFLDDLSDPFWE